MATVWSNNFEESMRRIEEIVKRYPYVSVDTEFPGFLFNSPKDVDEIKKYEDLRKNVDNMKLIQLGLTFCDEHGNKPVDCTWEFNFKDFDPEQDTHVPKSIEMLKRNGIDFQKNKREGICLDEFGLKFREVLMNDLNVRWIVFHGLYDLAYILKTITGGRKKMPSSLGGFLRVVRRFFHHIFDLKFIAQFCPGLLNGELGLGRLGQILNVERVGTCHQAGSDSMLTSCAYSEMKNKYGFSEERFEGCLFGIKVNLNCYRVMLQLRPAILTVQPAVVVTGPYCYYRPPENMVLRSWNPHGFMYT